MKSEGLRKTISEIGGGRSFFNEKAQTIEKVVKNSVLDIKNELEKKYPNYTFIHEKNIFKYEIAKEIGIKNYSPSSSLSNIRPDGGVLYIVFGKEKYPILISEAKKQGTNSTRKKEGKKEQSKGNAIERSYKNYCELKLFCKNLDYFPFVMFVFGCDFKPGSSILDRLDALTEYKPKNKIHVNDKSKIASVFVKDENFSYKEVYDVMKKICDLSIKEVLKKYGK